MVCGKAIICSRPSDIKKVVISEGINADNMATTEPFNGNN